MCCDAYALQPGARRYRRALSFSMHTDITILALDHPGANDPTYRARRNDIAAAAQRFREHGGDIPHIHYTADETAVWGHVFRLLEPLHTKHARTRYREDKARLGLAANRIPELAELTDKLAQHRSFALHPIEGLVDARTFLSTLAKRVMLCTQYIRHGSKPEYTPEPDVIHEIIGHVPTFLDPDIVALTAVIGETAMRVDQDALTMLERLYWFTLEFGLIQEQDEIKALGAGVLSSVEECRRAFAPETKRIAFDLDAITSSPYDFSSIQPHYVICPPLPELRKIIETFCANLI